MNDLKEKIRKLKYEYDSGHGDHLGRDFFSPCLQASTLYKRETSDFTSNVLVDWASALPKIVDKDNDQCQIQMIAHPNLSQDDKEILEKTLDDKKRDEYLDEIGDHIILGAEEFAKGNNDRTLRLELFYWLITTKRMILKFAFPKHINRPGIFHKKVGIFHFPWKDKVAFQGGANETVGGMHRNIESIDVYHSWKEEGMERINEKERKFDLAWNDKAEGYQTKRLSQKTLERCSSHAPVGNKLPTLLFENKLVKETSSITGKSLWPHQEKAVEKFLYVKNGILEMATGTGKTFTALSIAKKLFDQKKINSLIITTDGNDLLDQWQKEVRNWTEKNNFKDIKIVHGYYKNYNKLSSYIIDNSEAAIIISRNNLNELFEKLPDDNKPTTFIIHDEVHGMGSPKLIDTLNNTHKSFTYRLGMSATPEREYGDEGNLLIKNELGDTFYKYELEDAIKDGVLCEVDYAYEEYNLNQEENARIAAIMAKAENLKKQGKPMSDAEIGIAISSVRKNAENKIEVLENYIKSNIEEIKNSIFFVHTKDVGRQVSSLLHKYTTKYREYFDSDISENLIYFSEGSLDCLITCHRLSQGIDIVGLKQVFIIASDRTRLETIQRIGRCLRKNPDDPEKKAKIFDLIDKSYEADMLRNKWLINLSKVRKS